VAALAVGLAACVPEPAPGEARRDPAPSFADARTTQVDGDGDHWSAAGVTLNVPDGAVTASVANVTVGTRIGEADSGIATEVFGSPVRIESAAAFAEPVTIAWDVSALPAEAAAAAALVRWDDERRVWVPEPGVPAVAAGSLSAQVTGGGIVTWATTALADPAASAPDAQPARCGDAALPGWVAASADPDRARPESALTACLEAHQSDVLTVKTRSRDAVTRVLELTDDDATFDWTTRDGAVRGRFWQLAAGLVDDDATALLPPGAGVDVGLSAPADDSSLRAVARVDTRTATLDVLAGFARRVSFGEVADPAVADLVSTLYSCGAPEVMPLTDAATVAGVGAALTGCAAALAETGSAFADAFRDPSADAARVQGARAAAAAARIGGAGAFETLSAASADALVAAAAAPAGGASWTVLARRDTAEPGAWQPTCTDAVADAAALFEDLAVQPQFAAQDLSSDPQWRAAAVAAVAPLETCAADERARLAARLPDEWADPAAARAVVDAIAGLGLSLLSCDDLFGLASPIAAGFHELRGVSTSGTGRVACGWASEKDKAATDADLTSSVQVWVSRETADAEEVTRRREKAARSELGGLQESAALDAAGGFVVGAYVPAGLELEAWLPGYRIAITASSTDEPTQWRMPEGVAAIERIAAALAAG
jgi:hypothetical protein